MADKPRPVNRQLVKIIPQHMTIMSVPSVLLRPQESKLHQFIKKLSWSLAIKLQATELI